MIVIVVAVTDMTANGAVEAIMFADVTATPETDLQRLCRCSSSLLGGPPMRGGDADRDRERARDVRPT